jgi:hypothetical protein
MEAVSRCTCLLIALAILLSQPCSAMNPIASGLLEDSIPLGSARPGVVHTRPDPARCNDYIAKAQTVISDLPPTAKGHHWVVVCSLDTWSYALRRAGAWGRTNTAFTNYKTKTTFINGAVFEEPEQFYRQTVYHEAGHVLCACSNEKRANLEAGRLLVAPTIVSSVSSRSVLGK